MFVPHLCLALSGALFIGLAFQLVRLKLLVELGVRDGREEQKQTHQEGANLGRLVGDAHPLVDEAELVDEVEEEGGEEQRPPDFLHPLRDEPPIVQTAVVVPVVPGGCHHGAPMHTHMVKLLRPGTRPLRSHFVPIVEERPNHVVYTLALLVQLTR